MIILFISLKKHKILVLQVDTFSFQAQQVHQNKE